jgi:hypothetical protein
MASGHAKTKHVKRQASSVDLSPATLDIRHGQQLHLLDLSNNFILARLLPPNLRRQQIPPSRLTHSITHQTTLQTAHCRLQPLHASIHHEARRFRLQCLDMVRPSTSASTSTSTSAPTSVLTIY